MKKNKISLKVIKHYETFLLEEERSQATIAKYMRDIHHFYTFLPKDKVITKEAVIAYKQSLSKL